MPVALRFTRAAVAGLFALAIASPGALSQEPKTKSPAAVRVKPPPLRLSPDSAVWVDTENKRLIVEGEVCLTRGQLEMFACPKGTKEHESVVAVDAKAYVVHAGLLALGAKQGRPVQFDPEYVPASGARIDIYCFWIAEDGSQKQATAQQWIRNLKTKKPLEYPWVFAGSDFWLDENTGKRHYLGETGDFICVSNFPSATLDLPVKSSQDNENLLYEAFTENIPPRGTRVTLVLVPRTENDPTKDAKPTAAKGTAKAVKK